MEILFCSFSVSILRKIELPSLRDTWTAHQQYGDMFCSSSVVFIDVHWVDGSQADQGWTTCDVLEFGISVRQAGRRTLLAPKNKPEELQIYPEPRRGFSDCTSQSSSEGEQRHFEQAGVEMNEMNG